MNMYRQVTSVVNIYNCEANDPPSTIAPILPCSNCAVSLVTLPSLHFARLPLVLTISIWNHSRDMVFHPSRGFDGRIWVIGPSTGVSTRLGFIACVRIDSGCEIEDAADFQVRRDPRAAHFNPVLERRPNFAIVLKNGCTISCRTILSRKEF